FAYEAFMVAYGTAWGVGFDELGALGKTGHGLDDQALVESVIKNLRNVSLARAFKGAVNGKFNPENLWIAPAVAAGSTLLVKSPDIVSSVATNISNWYHNQSTDWSK